MMGVSSSITCLRRLTYAVFVREMSAFKSCAQYVGRCVKDALNNVANLLQ